MTGDSVCTRRLATFWTMQEGTAVTRRLVSLRLTLSDLGFSLARAARGRDRSVCAEFLSRRVPAYPLHGRVSVRILIAVMWHAQLHIARSLRHVCQSRTHVRVIKYVGDTVYDMWIFLPAFTTIRRPVSNHVQSKVLWRALRVFARRRSR